jgi:hypothetical protein
MNLSKYSNAELRAELERREEERMPIVIIRTGNPLIDDFIGGYDRNDHRHGDDPHFRTEQRLYV